MRNISHMSTHCTPTMTRSQLQPSSDWHIDHISTYILNKIPSTVPITAIAGTGGTPISAYLCRSAVGTLDARIRPQEAVSVALPTLCDIQCRLDMKRNLLADTSYCK